ncbi:TIGR03943 family putative permease subunit [Streptomyces albogriseolus]|uniref:TIGR03943 family putative permease subunit n=1 Tax=Streptomyces albogriseolus TaxID=1887 RepID=UPI0033B93C7A
MGALRPHGVAAASGTARRRGRRLTRGRLRVSATCRPDCGRTWSPAVCCWCCSVWCGGCRDRASGAGQRRPLRRARSAGPSHAHPRAPRVAWLLALPAVALLCFPPPALGSCAAREEAGRAEKFVGTFPALPAGDPVELSLAEFGSRAAYDSGYSLRSRTVRLTGFVTRDDDGTWYVTRLRVACCAADATAVKAEVRGVRAPETDTWVAVTGTWHPRGRLGSAAAWPPLLDATDVRPIAAPADPYEER